MKTLIVDDERLARSELLSLLKSHSNIDVVGEAADAFEAKALIESLKPDLIFLDIQMPGKDGFELLQELSVVPEIIFVTAYDQYAIKAFEANAIDYVLKPVEPERLAKAISRVQPRGLSSEESELALTLSNKVFLKDGENCWFVRLEDISALESIGNYTRVYFEANKPLIRRSLAKLEERFSKRDFFRANRQMLINLHHVLDVDIGIGDALEIKLKNNMSVELSRRQSLAFKQVMSL